MTEGSCVEAEKKGTQHRNYFRLFFEVFDWTPVCIGEGAVKWESMETDCDRSERYEVSMRMARPVAPKVEESVVRRS